MVEKALHKQSKCLKVPQIYRIMSNFRRWTGLIQNILIRITHSTRSNRCKKNSQCSFHSKTAMFKATPKSIALPIYWFHLGESLQVKMQDKAAKKNLPWLKTSIAATNRWSQWGIFNTLKNLQIQTLGKLSQSIKFTTKKWIIKD